MLIKNLHDKKFRRLHFGVRVMRLVELFNNLLHLGGHIVELCGEAKCLFVCLLTGGVNIAVDAISIGHFKII